MGTRITGFVVTLEHDMHENDAERLRDAILLLRGIISVTSQRGDLAQHMSDERARYALHTKLVEFIREK